MFGVLGAAFVVAAIIGAAAPVIGTFVVLRRYALLADTLSHTALLGIACATATRGSPLWVAMGTVIVAAVALERLRQSGKIANDALLALFMSGSLAISVIILAKTGGGSAMSGYLFGSLATVDTADMIVTGCVASAVTAMVALLYRGLAWIALDEETARASGIPAGALGYAMMIASALFIAVAVRTAGVLLVGALMVIPVVTAMQLRLSLKALIATASFFSALSAVGGVAAAYMFDLSSGAAIVLVALGILALVMLRSKLFEGVKKR